MNVIFFQDSLEELKLVARGSLFQVAGLQDCFLQQSEPVAASTGAGSRAVSYRHQHRQSPGPPKGLGPRPKRWAVRRAGPREAAADIRLLRQNPGQGILSLPFFIFITHMNFELAGGTVIIIFEMNYTKLNSYTLGFFMIVLWEIVCF